MRTRQENGWTVCDVLKKKVSPFNFVFILSSFHLYHMLCLFFLSHSSVTYNAVKLFRSDSCCVTQNQSACEHETLSKQKTPSWNLLSDWCSVMKNSSHCVQWKEGSNIAIKTCYGKRMAVDEKKKERITLN